MAGDNVVNVGEDNWTSEVIESSTPVLVDFWAEWCGPCRAIAPALDQLATEKDGTLKIAKVDVDAHSALAAQFEVRSIPTLLLFKNGDVVERMTGAMAKPQLEAKLTPHL